MDILCIDNINLLYASEYTIYQRSIISRLLKDLSGKNSNTKVYRLHENNINENMIMSNLHYSKIYADLIIKGSKLIDLDTHTNYESHILHSNVLLIDNIRKEIIRFEPHGWVTFCPKIDALLKSISDSVEYKFIPPRDYQNYNGPQTLQNQIDINVGKNKSIPGKTCAIWCLYLIHYCLLNDDNTFITNYINFYKSIENPLKATAQISGYITYVCNIYNIRGPVRRSYKSITQEEFIEMWQYEDCYNT